MKNKEKLNILFASRENIDNYVKFFEKAYEVNVIPFESHTKVKNSDIDLIVFIGNSHIHPTNYKEKLNSNTNANLEIDDEEYNIHYRFNISIPRIGIGRGAHLLTTCSGGKIIQNVTGHKDTEHLVNVAPYGTYSIKSNHDQMMYPFNLKDDDYKLLGFTKHFESTKYLGGEDNEFKLSNSFLEPEIVQYTKSNSLCFQLDPTDNESFDEISLLLIDKLLKKQFKKEVVEIREERREEPRTQFGRTGVGVVGGINNGFGRPVSMEQPTPYFGSNIFLNTSTGDLKENNSKTKSKSDMLSESYSRLLEQSEVNHLKPKSDSTIPSKKSTISWYSDNFGEL